MKKILVLFVLLCVSKFSISQDFKFGIEVSPSLKLQSIKNVSTGLRTAVGGYGFNFGLPLKVDFIDKSLSTGIIYQFTAFDNKINNFLISSIRLHAIDIPIIFNFPAIENFYLDAGGGVSYIFSSREYGGGVWVSRNSTTSQIQPYLALGGSTIINKNDKAFELAIHAKAHPFNLWKFSGSIRTQLIAFDLNLRYYF
jgi:hypothetical protein